MYSTRKKCGGMADGGSRATAGKPSVKSSGAPDPLIAATPRLLVGLLRRERRLLIVVPAGRQCDPDWSM